MQEAKLMPELWGRLAGVLLTMAAESPSQRVLVGRFLEELDDPSLTRTEQMQTLCVALSAVLATPASGSGAVATTSPHDSASLPC